MISLRPEFQEMNRQQIEAHLIAKAERDPAFRRSLLSEPRATLENELGLQLPAGFKVRIEEESADCLYLVLPPPVGELSDLELDAVAGGKDTSNNSTPQPTVSPGMGSIVPNLKFP